jgi:hypothetical protein
VEARKVVETKCLIQLLLIVFLLRLVTATVGAAKWLTHQSEKISAPGRKIHATFA